MLFKYIHLIPAIGGVRGSAEACNARTDDDDDIFSFPVGMATSLPFG